MYKPSVHFFFDNLHRIQNLYVSKYWWYASRHQMSENEFYELFEDMGLDMDAEGFIWYFSFLQKGCIQNNQRVNKKILNNFPFT